MEFCVTKKEGRQKKEYAIGPNSFWLKRKLKAHGEEKKKTEKEKRERENSAVGRRANEFEHGRTAKIGVVWTKIPSILSRKELCHSEEGWRKKDGAQTPAP